SAYALSTEWEGEEVTSRWQNRIEFFDYGADIEIEAPDPADVFDFEDWLDEPFDPGLLPDPFEGADCYGDRMAECLQPNPDLEDLYGDPTACQGEEARVCLAPAGYVRRDVVEAILDFHRET